jgi:signal transduction histidine kinase
MALQAILLTAVREIRSTQADEHGVLARRLLEILAAACDCAQVTLRLLPEAEEIRAGAEAVAGPAKQLELHVPRPAGSAELISTRTARDFDDDDALAIELLAGEVVSRIDHSRSDQEARHARRQIELLRTLSHAASEALELPEVADRAAHALLGAFAGAHVLVHVMAEGRLNLVARRIDEGSRLEAAPDWLQQVPVDGPMIVARAAREDQVMSRSFDELPADHREAMRSFGLQHLLVVPLRFDGAVFGTITVAHRIAMPWDPQSLRLLDSAATQLGVDFARVHSLAEERRRAEDLGLLNELGAIVGQHLELPAVLSAAVNQLARVMNVPRVHIFLADPSNTVLVGVACTEELEADVVVPASTGAVGAAFRAREPVVVEHAAEDLRTTKALVNRIHMRSILAVPLISGGSAIGVLALAETRHERKFTAHEVARAVAVANLVAPAVTNAKMFDDLRRSYEALAHTQAALVTNERLAALGELSAVIAHEVRNPLAIIFNSLGTLRRLGALGTDETTLLDIVGEEAARLNRIVGDLLDFVRPYSSHPRAVQVDAILEGAVDAARRAASPNGSVEIRTHIDVKNEVFLDGTMLQQALINLIVNAVQATPKGKRVTVSARIENDASGEARLRCDVLDEGQGIEAADALRVFQPFYTTKATGTGLGLAVVRRIVDALGGAIEVARAGASGTRFTLNVPLVPPGQTARRDET